MPTYAVKNWERDFENAESRRTRHLRWVPVPNRHDGRGYRRLTRHPRAPEIFSAWCLILQVASKMPTRGILEDDDGPLTADDLSDKTGFHSEVFELAFNVLSDNKIGWIIDVSSSNEHPGMPGQSAGTSGDARVEGKGREWNGSELKTPPTPASGECGSGVSEAAAMRPERSEGAEHPTGAAKRQRRSPKCETLPPGFVKFWDEWPDHDRKLSKGKCARIWERRNLEDESAEILAGLRRWKASDAWTKDGGAFISLVTTWLNDSRWTASPRPAEKRAEDSGNGFVRAEVTPDLIRAAMGEEGES